jgi:hypothetical protein
MPVYFAEIEKQTITFIYTNIDLYCGRVLGWSRIKIRESEFFAFHFNAFGNRNKLIQFVIADDKFRIKITEGNNLYCNL